MSWLMNNNNTALAISAINENMNCFVNLCTSVLQNCRLDCSVVNKISSAFSTCRDIAEDIYYNDGTHGIIKLCAESQDVLFGKEAGCVSQTTLTAKEQCQSDNFIWWWMLIAIGVAIALFSMAYCAIRYIKNKKGSPSIEEGVASQTSLLPPDDQRPRPIAIAPGRKAYTYDSLGFHPGLLGQKNQQQSGLSPVKPYSADSDPDIFFCPGGIVRQ